MCNVLAREAVIGPVTVTGPETGSFEPVLLFSRSGFANNGRAATGVTAPVGVPA